MSLDQINNHVTRRTLLRAGLFSALAVPARYSLGATDGKGGIKISPVTLALAGYVVQASQKALPPQTLEATKHHLLDTLAAMISGTHLLAGEKAIA